MPNYTHPFWNRLDQQPHIDLGGNPRPAEFGELLIAHDRQHTLMTSWAAAAHYITFALETGAPATKTVTTRIPPSCTWLDLGVLVYGKGAITVTSAVDAVGTLFRVTTDTVGGEHAAWQWTIGPTPDTNGAESGRSIQVATTASWQWTSVDLTFTFADITTGVGIFGVVVAPVLLPVPD